MAVDWIGFSYAAAIVFGGFMGYKRKGSVMSLIAGLIFGGLSAYGAYNISNDPKDITFALLSSGLLSVVMGMRYKKSGKLLPAGIMTGLRSESDLLNFHSNLLRFIDGVPTFTPDGGVTGGTTLTRQRALSES